MTIESISNSDDLFLYSLGDGYVEFDVGTGKDVVRLGPGITPKSPVALWQMADGGDNLAQITFGEGQTLTLLGFVGSKATVVFADGSVWDSAYVTRLVNASRTTGFDAIQIGTDKTKKLVGGGLDDLLIAGSINTTLEGRAGNDYLEGGKGKDTLLGGAGNDYLDGGAGDDKLYGEDGDDQLYAEKGADTLDGGAGDDRLWDKGSKHTLLGGSGNDVLDVFGDRDTVDGGSGNDTIYVGGTKNQIAFGRGAGHDTIYGGGEGAPGTAYFIKVGPGLKASDLTFAKELVHYDEDDYTAENLRIAIKGSSDSVVLWEFYNIANASHTLYDSLLVFADGSSLSAAKIIYGMDADVFYATNKADTFNLSRGIGADSVVGFANKDLVQLGSGLALSDLVVRNTVYGDLLLSVAGSHDSLRLDDFFDSNISSSATVVRAANGTTLTVAQLRALALNGTDGKDVIYGFTTNDSIAGGKDDDFIAGGGGRDTLDGGTGNDTLIGAGLLTGGSGNDELTSIGTSTLQGGQGDDRLTLTEESFAELIHFGLGDGNDRVDYFAVGDTLELGTGVSASSLSFRANQGVFSEDEFWIGGVIKLADGSSIDISGISDSASAVALRFADGGSLTHKQLYALFQRGTPGDDWILDTHLNDSLSGLGGDDDINGYYGNDTLDGGEGNDRLSDEAGNNLLIGGAGNDTLDVGGPGTGSNVLDGGTGNDFMASGPLSADRFVFNRGYGNDEIYFGTTFDGEVLKADVIQLGTANAADVWFRQSGSNLQIGFVDTADSLTLDDWYAEDSAARRSVDRIELSNGTTLPAGSIDTLVNAMAAFAPPAIGQTVVPEGYLQTLNPVLAANWH